MPSIITAEEAIAMIPNGASIMVGGFMACGSPLLLIDTLLSQQKKNLTIINNDNGKPDCGVGKLIVSRQASKTITSHIGLNPESGRLMATGELEVELVPQGTLAERIRAAGAGLGGILTPTGVGTIVEEGKQKITVNGKDYLLELPLFADFALIKAHKADMAGNLLYRCSAQNFNPLMAMAGKVVIAEVEHIVPIGDISPDAVHTPGVFVNYLVQA